MLLVLAGLGAGSLALAPLALCSAGAARADTPRPALIVSADRGGSLTPLPGCVGASTRLAARLREAGFHVETLAAPSNGELGAGLRRFAAAADGAPEAVLSFCGYADRLGARLFLLPGTAQVDVPGDLLTEGMLVKVPLDALGHAQAGRLLLDLYARPGGAVADLPGLAGQPRGGGIGIAAAMASEPSAPPRVAAAATAAWGEAGGPFWDALRAVLLPSGGVVLPPAAGLAAPATATGGPAAKLAQAMTRPDAPAPPAIQPSAPATPATQPTAPATPATQPTAPATPATEGASPPPPPPPKPPETPTATASPPATAPDKAATPIPPATSRTEAVPHEEAVPPETASPSPAAGPPLSASPTLSASPPAEAPPTAPAADASPTAPAADAPPTAPAADGPPTAPAADGPPTAPAQATSHPVAAPPAAVTALAPLHRIPSHVMRPPDEPPGTIDENTVTMADRLRIQSALAARGDFTARVDGYFRPSSRAAIRRFQASLGDRQTGWLTEAEAAILLAPPR